MKNLSIAAGLLLITSSVAFAQTAGNTNTPRLDQRQSQQEQRIQQGVNSGELTGREAARMERGQDHLQSMENKAKADGTVTRRERAHLELAADKQSHKIRRQKHDRQHDLNHDGKTDRPLRAPRS